MECNRDEAIRAKTIAEKKLADKDFVGAKKFTLKAQCLYPGLDGISQMLTILDVYISAENKISGEVDWYGVLGVNPSDDDQTIKKQYRKLALMLHPDKNKSVGADGAFKLISEAWSLMSDKAKRLAYNERRNLRGFPQKVSSRSGAPSTAPGVNGVHSFAKRATSKPKSRSKNSTATRVAPTPSPAPPPATPPQVFHQSDTFWTVCRRCMMHCEYLKIYVNCMLICANCIEPFLAKEMPPPVNFPKSAHPSASNHASSRKSNNNLYNTNIFSCSFSRTNVDDKKAANEVNKQVKTRLKRERKEKMRDEHQPSKKRKSDGDGQSCGVKFTHQMSMGNECGSTDNVSGFRKNGFETDGSSANGYSGFEK